ncbi:putative O-methyltransferase [Hypoxylon sp. NC0597]|nr:putative O-methyltransferase [Hypoxylon sp. NC0597]
MRSWPFDTHIVRLATTILTHTHIIDEHLAKSKLPYPSFEADGPVDLNYLKNVEASRLKVIEATQELNDLLQGPKELVLNHQHNQLLHLRFISHFGIAKKVPLNGGMTFEDLANRICVEASVVRRILRFSIAHCIFREPRPGVIAHSAASRQIAENPAIADWVSVNVNELWPLAIKTVDALTKWRRADEPNQTGFSLANETNDPFYVEVSKHPERARRLRGAMSLFITNRGYHSNRVVDAYPWGSLGRGTVVHIGESDGEVAFAMARAFPNLRLIVQDLPEVIAKSKEQPGLRVEFMAHNIFEEQPVKGADAYIFRQVLHDWPDKYCVKILKALIPALKKGARVFVFDVVLNIGGEPTNVAERRIRAVDLTMLEVGNAKERSISEWLSLFGRVDSRFIFKNWGFPERSSLLCLVEIGWQE